MYHTRLSVTCDPLFSEILIAEISQAGFDSFLENENGFEAYAEVDRFDESLVAEIKNKYDQVKPLLFSWDRIEKKNWNEEWEKSYEPIIVDDRCVMRAEFHQIKKEYPYTITITPKMSFGTGHHQTTYLMIKAQMDMDHKNKMVMDAGCGTAILSIMASKLGAKSVEAFDIDEWSVINGKENIEVNNCENINIRQGMISELTFEDNYDIILANINKNVILDNLVSLTSQLKKGGVLLLSGLLAEDENDILAAMQPYALKPGQKSVKNNWIALRFNG